MHFPPSVVSTSNSSLIHQLSDADTSPLNKYSTNFLSEVGKPDPEKKTRALIEFVMSQKEEGDLSISLQDIFTALSTIKEHGDASPETIRAITDYEDHKDLVTILETGIKQYNYANYDDRPILLKIDWVEVVTHQSENVSDIEANIVRHFQKINRDASDYPLMPSDHLLDTIIALLLHAGEDINVNTLYKAMSSLTQNCHASREMKSTIDDYLAYVDFDVLITLTAERRKDNLIDSLRPLVDFKYVEHIWRDLHLQYFSWKDLGRLSQTCQPLNKAFHRLMKSQLTKRAQGLVERSFDERSALVMAFPKPENRIYTQTAINRKGIDYIQKELGIDCGPNMLIAIRHGLSLDEAQKRLEESNEDLRKKCDYLTDEQFLLLKKYIVDGLFPEEVVESLDQEAVTKLVDFLKRTGVQGILERNITLGHRMSSGTQCLQATPHGIHALCNDDFLELHNRKGGTCITLKQLLTLSALDYALIDNDTIYNHIFRRRIKAEEIIALTGAKKEIVLFSLKKNPEPNLEQLKALLDLNADKKATLVAHWEKLTGDQRKGFEHYTLPNLVEIILHVVDSWTADGIRAFENKNFKKWLDEGYITVDQLSKLSKLDYALIDDDTIYNHIYNDKIKADTILELNQSKKEILFYSKKEDLTISQLAKFISLGDDCLAAWTSLSQSDKKSLEGYTLPNLVQIILNVESATQYGQRALVLKNFKTLANEGHIKIDQIVNLSEMDFKLICNDTAWLSILQDRNKVTEILKLTQPQKEILQSLKPGELSQKQFDAFISICTKQGNKDKDWRELTPLIKPEHYQQLEKDDSLRAFLTEDNRMKIADFFKLPPENQQFLKDYWYFFYADVNVKTITWHQIATATRQEIALFLKEGKDKFIEQRKISPQTQKRSNFWF